MNEERRLAKEGNYESPICETIEDTHKTYNENLKLIIENLQPNERVLIGSHNLDSVELAKSLIIERNITDNRVTFG